MTDLREVRQKQTEKLRDSGYDRQRAEKMSEASVRRVADRKDSGADKRRKE